MQVKAERTGWRDLDFSKRHKEWGWDCPAVDVDFLMVEYDAGEPKALVEYKHERAALVAVGDKSRKALEKLASRGGVPAFGVRYYSHAQPDGSILWGPFRIVAINDLGMKALGERGPVTMSEFDYVTLLYRLRGRSLPQDVAPLLRVEWAA